MGQTALGQYVDQLSQTFTVSEQYGIYVTKIGVFFQTVSSTFPISLHIRIGRGILATGTKSASEMSSAASATAATETTFLFDEPIFLEQGTYNFSLESNDKNEYNVWHAKLGDFKLNTTQERVIKDLAPGRMSPTSAGSTQRKDPDSDIKFKIYRASFSANSGTAVFRDANPPVRLLGLNPLSADAADSDVHVAHPNHGFNINDKVNIQGVSGTVNGITAARLNGQRTITAVDYSGYKFAVPTGGPGQDSAVSYGGSAITATQQYRMDIAQLQMMEKKPGDTHISYSGAFTTSKSWAGTETPYGSTSGVSLVNQQNNLFDVPHVIANDSNEVTHLSSGESTTITATLVNDATNFTSPIIDLQRTQILAITNQIDRQDSASTTGFNIPLSFVAETDAANGSSASKHITKPVTLAVPATGLKVLFAGHRPDTGYLDLYFRTAQTGTDSDILEKSFVKATVDAVQPNDVGVNEFHEYEYTIGGDFASTLAEFDKYQIKLVMESTSTSKVPRVRDLRTIALN
jgi:hypothetical protein